MSRANEPSAASVDWSQVGGDRRIVDALDALYRWVDEEVATLGAVCRQSGQCCRFDAFGHRLYVTTLETAVMLRRLDAGPRRCLTEGDACQAEGCPFQIDRLCTVHPSRPLGCRVFFCDSVTSEQQHALYEQAMERLRMVHKQFGVPYEYLEWRASLQRLTESLTSGE